MWDIQTIPFYICINSAKLRILWGIRLMGPSQLLVRATRPYQAYGGEAPAKLSLEVVGQSKQPSQSRVSIPWLTNDSFLGSVTREKDKQQLGME